MSLAENMIRAVFRPFLKFPFSPLFGFAAFLGCANRWETLASGGTHGSILQNSWGNMLLPARWKSGAKKPSGKEVRCLCEKHNSHEPLKT